MRAPFPYFGGKSRIADEVWKRFGNVKNYVEPFCGSSAVLLRRPKLHDLKGKIETINDKEGLLANFWRAMVYAPDEVCKHADWPVNEADLHARHIWLLNNKEDLTTKLMGDPEWFDPKVAGWWVWGICAWLGRGWCSGQGSWQSYNGELINLKDFPDLSIDKGVWRQIPHLGSGGQGINRGLLRNDKVGEETNERGVSQNLLPIAARIKNVRVVCGDWTRVLGKTITIGRGETGVFLDPPYPRGSIDYNEGDREIYKDVQAWALENGDNPKFKIAVCGYDTDHKVLGENGWQVYEWKAGGGYGSQANRQARKNSKLERVWFSPHCLSGDQND